MCVTWANVHYVYLTESASSARIPTDENKVQFVRAARVHDVQLLLSLDDGSKEVEYSKILCILDIKSDIPQTRKLDKKHR